MHTVSRSAAPRLALVLLVASVGCLVDPGNANEVGQGALDQPWCNPAAQQAVLTSVQAASQSNATPEAWMPGLFDTLAQLGAVSGVYAPGRITIDPAPGPGVRPSVWTVKIQRTPSPSLDRLSIYLEGDLGSVRVVLSPEGVLDGSERGVRMIIRQGTTLCEQLRTPPPPPPACEDRLRSVCASIAASCQMATTECRSASMFSSGPPCARAEAYCDASVTCDIERSHLESW